MQVIPSINVQSFEEAQSKLHILEGFLPSDAWAQIDVADGLLTNFKNWGAADELSRLRTHLNIELHLMIVDVESVLRPYVDALGVLTSGHRRIIVHVEALRDMPYILGICSEAGIEVGLAVNPQTSIDAVFIYLRAIKFVQLLAVEPGPSGQAFQLEILSKIQLIKSQSPHVIIEVDGGINPDSVRQIKNAGGDIVVSAGYIFNHPVPKVAYEELARL